MSSIARSVRCVTEAWAVFGAAVTAVPITTAIMTDRDRAAAAGMIRPIPLIPSGVIRTGTPGLYRTRPGPLLAAVGIPCRLPGSPAREFCDRRRNPPPGLGFGPCRIDLRATIRALRFL